MTASECKRRYDADPTLLTALRLSYEKWADGVGWWSRVDFFPDLFRGDTCGLCLHFYWGFNDSGSYACDECLLYTSTKYGCCYLFSKARRAYRRNDRPAFQYWARKLRDKLHRLWREEKARVKREER